MDARFRTFALPVAVLSFLSAPGRSAEREAPVAVFVDDRAAVPGALLDEGKKGAAQIARRAGFRIVWLAEQPGPDGPDAVAIRLIVQPRFLGRPGRESQFLMGAAPESAAECGSVVYLFFDQIVQFADLRRVDPALVTGIVAAHEIGHVLLGRRSHSPEGLMRGDWSADDLRRAASGGLIFSPKEA